MKKSYYLFLFIVFGSHCIFAQNKPKFTNPIKITGSIGSRNYFSAGSQSPLYQANPFGYSLFGNVNIQITKHLSLPFSVSYSNRKATFSQPFNQFGISPTFKGITLHAGYRSLRFSDYTLNGFNILGGGFELQKGILRGGFMMGRFARPTATAEGNPISFLRTGWAGRIGLGKKENFVDLIVLRAEDNANSIPNSHVYGLTPAQNLVVGAIINQKINLGKGKNLLFKADAAMSIYTGDITAQGLDTTVYNLPPIIFKTVDANVSSKGVLAYNTSLAYSQKGMGLRLGYNRIDPGFASMGIYTITNDLEIISVAPRFSLAKNKLNFNGNLRLQRDNITGLKKRNTRRVLPNASLNYNPSQKFGVNLGINYSMINQTQGIKQSTPIPASQLMNQANYSVNLMPRLTIGKGQNINLSIGTNRLMDKGEDPERKKYSEYSGLNGTLNYGIEIEKLKSNFTAGATYFSLTNFDANTFSNVTKNNYGVNIGMDKKFLEDKLSATIGLAYTMGQASDKATNINLGASYRPHKHHSLTFNLFQAHSQYAGNENRNFNEFRGTLDYTYNF